MATQQSETPTISSNTPPLSVKEDIRVQQFAKPLVLLAFGVVFLGVIGFGTLSLFTQDSFWLLLTIVCFVNLLLYALGYQSLRPSRSHSILWRLPIGCILTLIAAQSLVGTQLVVVLPMLACFAVMLSLIKLRTVLVVAIVWLSFSIVLYFLEYFFKIYSPPLSISPQAEVITNLIIVALVSPVFIWLLVIPGRILTHTLQAQNHRLQDLLANQAQAESMLRESEQRLRDTFEHSAVGICQTDMDGNWLFINQTMCDMLGYSREELLALTIRDISFVDDFYQPDIQSLTRQQRGTPLTLKTEKRYVRKDGSILWAKLTISSIYPKGQLAYVLGVLDDITEHKKAEERVALQASILDQIINIVIATDPKGNIIYANKAAREVFPPGLVVEGASILKGFNLPQNLAQVQKIVEELTTTGQSEGEFSFNKKNPDQTAYVTANTIRDKDGGLLGYVGVATDISERRQIERDLAAQKERLSVTLRSIGDGVITADINNRVTMLNATAETFTGWTQAAAMGQPLISVFRVVDDRTDEAVSDPARHVLETAQTVGLPAGTVLVAQDGTRRFISSSAAPIWDEEGIVNGVVLVFRDVSERFRLEEELRKSQKLESLGLLAGGIAHDFNNILTAIAGNIGLAKMETRPTSSQFDLLSDAEAATLRASGLTRQLLTFAKGGAPLKKMISLTELLYESVTFALRGSKVRSIFELSSDLWPVEADAGQISQVINNLVINAEQAMPKGGQLYISADNVTLRLDQVRPGLKPGDFVRVCVKDEGTGIAPADLSKIFDPYFTTKKQGSGLGLATSYSIITRHGGLIEVESEVARGTTFFIHLPARKNATLPGGAGQLPMAKGAGSILLMDDDRALRELGLRALKRLGYDVVAVPDGAEAIQQYRERFEAARPFDVVIMDLTVPGGMGGQEAMRQLVRLDPKVKAIVSSGYSNDPIMANYQRYHFRDVLSKPFRLDELSAKVEKVLQSTS